MLFQALDRGMVESIIQIFRHPYRFPEVLPLAKGEFRGKIPPVMGECTAVGCFLEKQGGLVSFPLVTIAGLADGVNPCAIGMIVMLLGYLIVFAKKPEKILRIGITYIAAIFLTYLLIGLAFYSLVVQIQEIVSFGLVNRSIGIVLFVAGLWMFKDAFFPNLPLRLAIPSASGGRLMKLIESLSLPATALLGVMVTVLETPCSLPLYVGTATVLANSGLPLAGVIAYFLYYNLLFVLPLIVVLLVVWKGKQIVEIKEWEHRAERWMKLVLGLLLLILSAWLIYSSFPLQ